MRHASEETSLERRGENLEEEDPSTQLSEEIPEAKDEDIQGELEATKKKKTKRCGKGWASSRRIKAGASNHERRCRAQLLTNRYSSATLPPREAFQPPPKIRAKKNKLHQSLGLEDSSTSAGLIIAHSECPTEDWVTPDPSDEEEGGQEDMEITSGEDEPDEGDAPLVNQPDVPGLNAEPNDSFE
ncbi:hypothetical protein FNV43_RR16240 [Rhamnella rubrinervis]|uniref:Uncharacterized protein n=1 Tax=Rhamnella rubrinervis TaxID=2594499 RepID=A0A8K0EAA7_9ROSA|nr:hypothetical protein FNV43_RR16240 [Rhamnella rubrinervis]